MEVPSTGEQHTLATKANKQQQPKQTNKTNPMLQKEPWEECLTGIAVSISDYNGTSIPGTVRHRKYHGGKGAESEAERYSEFNSHSARVTVNLQDPLVSLQTSYSYYSSLQGFRDAEVAWERMREYTLWSGMVPTAPK